MISTLISALVIAIGLNLFAFIFAYKNQTDKLTDVTYALTFALLAGYYWFSAEGANDAYKLSLMFMIVIWSIRLGSYLFFRVMIKGKDDRFDGWRDDLKKYLRFWVLQGCSVWVLSIPFIIGLTKPKEAILAIQNNKVVMLGMAIWMIGFFIEALADRQKFRFRLNPENEGKFMNRGLFSIVRFPNYAGEILVWVGVFITVSPLLEGLEWLSVVSPLWITFLLVRLNGIPFLERSNKKRYAHQKEFLEYEANTKKLIPFIY